MDTSAKLSQPRWHWLYFLLAAFDVCTVSASLYLNHAIMGIYRNSVAANQAWAERLRDAAELGRLAAKVNAPGNDVFESRAVEAEAEKMANAAAAFDAQLQNIRTDYRDQVEPELAEPFSDGFDRLESALVQMRGEGARIFAAFRRNQMAEAGEHMAAMDRKLVAFNNALDDLQIKIGRVQARQFAEQTLAAETLQQFEYVVAILILLMVSGATIYGWKLARQVQAVQQEREQARAELERRVRARTAELSQANESLRASEQARTRLLQQVMSAQEDERRRIARDLHDGIGQSLTSVLLGLRTVEGAEDLPAARTRAAEVRGIAGEALAEVRRLAHALRPAVLDDLGLTAALERLKTDCTQVGGLEIHLDAQALEAHRLPESVETALYRIIQESLTNAIKHSAARHVHIRLSRVPNAVQVRIEDDGCGLDAVSVSGPTLAGLGLSGMRERAELLSGSFHLRAAPGQGTRIVVEIPCEDPHGEGTRPARG